MNMNNTWYLIIVWVLINAARLNADDGLTETNMYLKNTVFDKPYVCAMFVEETFDNARDASKSSFVDFWSIHSYSPQLKTSRQDYLPQSRLTSSGLTTTQGESLRLFSLKDGKVKQISGRTARTGELGSIEADPFKGFAQMPYFEPLILPIGGFRCLEARSGPRLNALDAVIGRYVFVDEDDTNFQLIKTLRHGSSTFYDRIVFDSRYGDMPTSVRRSNGEKGAAGEIINTKWGQIKDKWLPMVTETEVRIGDVLTWKVEFHWMLDNVPDEVFNSEPTGKVVRGLQLKELVFENAGSNKFMKQR